MANCEKPWEESPEISAGYLRRLRAGVRKTKGLGKYRSDGFTSKMWILPDGRPVSIGSLHFRWLQTNPNVALEFGLELASLPDDDTAIRLAALNRGFVRVNYEIRYGRLTVEANSRFWTSRIKDAVFVIIARNLDALDSMQARLLDDKGFIIRSGFASLFNLPNKEKLEHLPLISQSKRGTQMLNAYRRRRGKQTR